jgi:hypothetical protein
LFNINYFSPPEQQSLAQGYLEKWRNIARSTQRIDNQSAAFAIKTAYTAIDVAEPEILFFESPHSARDSHQFKEFTSQRDLFQVWKRLKQKLITEPTIHLRHELKSLSQFNDCEIDHDDQQEHASLGSFIPVAQLSLQDSIAIQFWSRYAWLFDFYYSMGYCDYEQSQWEALRLLVENCGRIYPFHTICLVCDRPIQLSFDQEFRLHSEVGPAVVFTDGYSIYARHGMKSDDVTHVPQSVE